MDRLSAVLESYRPRSTTVRLHAHLSEPVTLAPADPNAALLCLVQRGPLTWSAGTGTAQALQTGDLLWITGTQPGQLQPHAEDATAVVCEIQFGSDRDNPLLERLPPAVHMPADLHDASLALAPVMELMLQEALRHECGQSHVQNRLAEVLLIRVLRFLMRHALLQQGVIAALGDIRLARAITAMHDRPGEAWRVDSLAHCAGMSRTAFNNRFREVVGRPPMTYLGDWRMKLASQWLADRRLSVAEIGERLGYSSETAFRRAFRNITGTAPGEHR